MARGDGIHRTNARNMRLTAAKIGNAQQHNEREKESYVNQDIVPERTHLNVHSEALRPEILEHIRDTEKRLIQGIDQEDVKICRKVLVQMIQNLAENKTENKEEDENDE